MASVYTLQTYKIIICLNVDNIWHQIIVNSLFIR